MPWRGSRSDLTGRQEDVRPINWANRPKSYIQRTGTVLISTFLLL